MPQCHTCQHATTGNHKRRTRPINLPCHQDASVCVDLLIFAATYEDHISAVLILAEPLQILNQLWKTGQGRVTVWCTCAHRTAGNPSVLLSFSLFLCVPISCFVVVCFVLRAQIFFSVLFMFSLPRSVRIVLGAWPKCPKRAEPVYAENANSEQTKTHATN